MKYFIFVNLYFLTFILVSIRVYRKNGIDISDYRNRKTQVRKMLGNYFLAMLIFNFISAVIYKLLSYHFLSFNSLLAVVFCSLIQVNIIALYHPKIITSSVCWKERTLIAISPLLFFIIFLRHVI